MKKSHGDEKLRKALAGSALDFLKIHGMGLEERLRPINEYGSIREDEDLYFSANRVLTSLVSIHVSAEIAHHAERRFLNFSSQDYLGLSQDEEVKNAARAAIDEFGIHVASSPILTGRNKLTQQLEYKLADVLKTDQCLLFPTGWGACFGAIAALVTPGDHLVMDALSHNSLQVGAAYSTEHIHKFRHNNVEHLESILKNVRAKNGGTGLFVVLEGLYSMNSDMPDLPSVLRLIRQYEANLILDIAHDFGSMGQHGLGILESIGTEERENIVLCGAFSKSFATNGGFVAGPALIRKQMIVFGPSYTFSNGISPMQCGVALKCAEIIFSDEGDRLRENLHRNIHSAIQEFTKNGFQTLGIPSPIVPVLIGEESLARLTAREITRLGLLANMAEFPAVPRGKSIFRFQLMSNHDEQQIKEAVKILVGANKASVKMIHELGMESA